MRLMLFFIILNLSFQNLQQKSKMLNEEEENSVYCRSVKRLPVQVNQSILGKISNHLEMQHITIEEFWLSEKNFARPEDIVDFCRQRGLILDDHDATILKGELFPRSQTISLQSFVRAVPYWGAQGRELLRDFHMKRSDKLILSYENRSKERAKSGLPRPKSQLEQRSISRQGSVVRFQKETKTSSGLAKNNSLKYLRRFKEREQVREKELNDNIEKNKIDEEYAMLTKMSQINTLNKDRENSTAYRAYKSAEGVIKVRVFHLNKFQKEISLKEFDTVYKNFKKTAKENKEWSFQPQSTPKGPDQLQNLKNRNNQKSERQQQLKNLLVNTVNLTNLLKEQIKIFKMKGIYGCENI